MTQIKKRIIIEGDKVHNVGYRPFLMERAQELGILNFHPKNLKRNGKQIVEVLVGGEDEGISSFIDFTKDNFPETAEVDNVSTEDYVGDIITIKDFSRIFSASQLSKIVQAGLGMLDKQDQTIEILGKKIDNVADKQDQMLGKQDQMLGKQDQMLGKQDQMLGKQDQMLDLQKQTVDKLDSFHQDTVQKFDTLREDYGRISKDIATAVQGIEKVVQNTEKLLEKSERDRKNFEKSMDKVANAILKLAEKK